MLISGDDNVEDMELLGVWYNGVHCLKNLDWFLATRSFLSLDDSNSQLILSKLAFNSHTSFS
jgi:hypothetical protein